MSEHPVAAAYRAVNRRATEASEIWGARAYPDLAPAGVERPYLLWFVAAGTEANERKSEDAELVLVIKGVSNNLAEAFAMAARIDALFNDQGQYDTSTPLDAGAAWSILTTKRELMVHLVETIDGKQVYHAGAQFRVRMEAN